MEILYLWVKDYFPFNVGEFNFNGNFNVRTEINEENKLIEININVNDIFPVNFFGEPISNISCILGKNGSGKSRLVNLLINILNPNVQWYSLPDYILIEIDHESRSFNLRHNLIEFGESFLPHHLIPGADKYSFNIQPPNNYTLNFSKNDLKYQVVFYAPFLDLTNTPTRFDRKEYIDVSTDFLLIKDKDTEPKEEDPFSTFRFKNVERQFEFAYNFKSNFDVNSYLQLPDEIELYSIESRFDEHWRHNLSPSAQMIRSYFIGENHYSNRGVIGDKIHELGGELYELNEKGKRKSKKYSITLKHQISLHFLGDFVNHYFSAWNSSNHWLNFEIGVNVNEFLLKDEWQAFQYFLSKQLWLNDNGNSALNLLNYLKNTFKNENIKIDSLNDQRKIISDSKDAILGILKAHNGYLESLPAWEGLYSVPDFIQIDWRNISSGEKAFLDLFSRMYFAYKSAIDRDTDKYSRKITKSTQWIYLFLDEGEIGFHPDWQKRYVYLLYSILPIIFKDIKLQIILTSHSPFVASDLPCQNIIFLNKRNGRVEINKETISNTFAANIHTLLADGFFISNGLIGEFAKKKIQEVIDWLNDPGSDISPKIIEENSKLISMIGEPIIKHKLLDDLDRKLGRNDEINKIDKELNRLQTIRQQLIQKKRNAES